MMSVVGAVLTMINGKNSLPLCCERTWASELRSWQANMQQETRIDAP